jgi:hypothetical protein
MAYTSSALSFLLEDLGKIVVRKDLNTLYTQVMTALDIDRSPNPSIAIAK